MLYLMLLHCLFTTFLQTELNAVQLGDATVYIAKQSNGPGKHFLHVHQNEITALEAAKYIIDTEGGSLITLLHNGERNIVFKLNQVRYEFDPNRMFSDLGIKKTLSDFGPYSKEAHQVVEQFANQLLAMLPTDRKVIAVHNNKDYSLKEYFPGQSLASDAKTYHYCVDSNARNFYFVTQEQEYVRLRDKGYNVALQGNAVQNDGSLSYRLSRDNYVNVEAAYGAFNAQVAMLRLA